ncbi:serine hydrolase [Lysobacter sp. H23M47]|uniref:serine hydrolase n=1 Tax=Lysobacter sp. H23M47 TaxID=2781024 RepID=UPI0018808E42|nr:serine hydrolase [Lysobacter sp. H23M47]QOW23546.1 serine hydrolase [Lysobacter sp. H23M47]
MPITNRSRLGTGKCLALAVALTAALALVPAAHAQDVATETTAPEAKARPDLAVFVDTPAGLPGQLADFDAYIEDIRERFEVPAMAVAIVKDGRVVLERGYGTRDLDSKVPVDEHTLFAIASNTKAFTAASLSMLADEGKLKMDDRVVDHLPWFRMSDAYVTGEMRIRDLLAHRSGLGLGAGDLLYWPGSKYTTEEVARRLKDVPLKGGFRDRYAYDNILFGVAQLVVESASGQPFREFLQSRIFRPLGMHDTRFNSDYLQPSDNVATGYAQADFTRLVAAPRVSWGNVSGAGGIYSSVHDLTNWVRVQLDGGVISGEGDSTRRLFSEKRQREMWSMITPIPVPKPSVPALAAATPNYAGYGEGWSLSDYRGSKLVWHTGGWPGFVSRITLVPQHDLGIIVLTSAEQGGAFQAATMRVLDAYLGGPRTDWTSAYLSARGNAQEKADKSWQEHIAKRDLRSRPSLPLSGYAATYRDPWYGDIIIERSGEKLRIRFDKTPDLVGTLSHWQHDTFVVRWDERWLNADAFLTFALQPDGAVREARMQAISPLTDFSFDFHDLRLVPLKPDAE